MFLSLTVIILLSLNPDAFMQVRGVVIMSALQLSIRAKFIECIRPRIIDNVMAAYDLCNETPGGG